MKIGLPIVDAPASSTPHPPEAPAGVREQRRLIDSYGRTIRDLRISITDRCNFRCTYCMEPDTRFMPASDLLTVDEYMRVARICVDLGVRKIRLTGGEPTVHAQLDDLITGLARLPIADLAMTTNGSLCPEPRLRQWRALGLGRLTVSLDSLRPERFAAIARATTPVETVLQSILDARTCGLDPVRVDVVLVRGVNDDEIADLASVAHTYGVEVRFIEFMPLDGARAWERSDVVGADEVIAAIEERHPLVPLGRRESSATSLDYGFTDGSPGRIGIIAPVTRPFCGACSRMRLTADGKIRLCLFSTEEYDVRALLRSGVDDETIARYLVDVTWTKQAGHGISTVGFVQPQRPMSSIGG